MKLSIILCTLILHTYALHAMNLKDTLSPESELILLRLAHIQARINLFAKSHIPDQQTVCNLLRNIITTQQKVQSLRSIHKLISCQHYMHEEKRVSDYTALQNQWKTLNVMYADYQRYAQKLAAELKNTVAHDALKQEVSSALEFLKCELTEVEDILENTNKKLLTTSQSALPNITCLQEKPLSSEDPVNLLLNDWELV